MMKKIIFLLVMIGFCFHGNAEIRIQDSAKVTFERPKPQPRPQTKKKDLKYCPEKYGFKVLEKMKCPRFEVEMLDGSTTNIADLKGSVVLIDFVGVKCCHCIAGMQKFDKAIFDRFKGEDLVVLPIFVKYKKKEDVQAVCDRIGYHHPVALDKNNEIGSVFFEGGIPRYFVVDRRGKIVYTGPSYHPGQFEEMLNRIEKALKK